MTGSGSSRAYTIDAGRLWAGGVATAIVAGLVAIVGILIARGLVNVAILAPKGSGVWGNANTVTYALLSALAGLVATGIMHLLAVSTPSSSQFFGWIAMLLTLIAVVLPLSLSVGWPSKIATALLNLIIGIVITILVTSMAANARHRARQRQRPEQYPPQPYSDQPYPTRRYPDQRDTGDDQTRTRWDY